MQQQADKVVDVQGLTLRTVDGPVYENVTFTLEKGQVGCLFGSGGSGKTGLLLTLGARMRFKGGKATVFGYDLAKQYRKVRDLSSVTVIRHINDVPENLTVYDLVAAELATAGKRSNKAAVQEYLEKWDFSACERVRYRNLEANDRSYFGILLACVSDPELLLVDDVQTGITQHRSIEWVGLFKRLAQERDMAVLFCCNEFDIANKADGVLIMSDKAALQRQAVLQDQGAQADARLLGVANNVNVEEVA